MSDIKRQIEDYAHELEGFIERHELPSEWFEYPDHVAFKAADSQAFKSLIGTFQPLSEQISYVEMDGRRLATAQLLSHVTLGSFGDIQWVELMEPRPARVGSDVVGFEHAEFYFPNFEAVQKVLSDKEVVYEIQDNPGHSWVNIVINNKGQELKLNNGRLKDIVAKETAKGETKFF